VALCSTGKGRTAADIDLDGVVLVRDIGSGERVDSHELPYARVYLQINPKWIAFCSDLWWEMRFVIVDGLGSQLSLGGVMRKRYTQRVRSQISSAAVRAV
jgi:hypothetical protein